MPIQAPQWTDYLNCPVCCREFGSPPRSPVSLGCGHTLCRHCLNHLHKKQCPFDQTLIQSDPDDLVVNTALLQLAGYSPPAQPYHPPCIQALPERDQAAYDVIVRCLEHLAMYLKYIGNGGGNIMGSRLSRPMQRKLVTLLQCAILDEEGRGRMARAARSLGERTVTELILQNQNPQQISAYLWAAVRSRGCQFLGPAMQEEVLKLVLLALEDGSALSRKVLVMFVVQRLKPHFPQASKTSIGHVVQLLYRASCFKVSKRECDSSLMQLKEEFRSYESLRREHDAQIVQIATESGLRIAPDQWSALLYGDTVHKSHMQSIIDKLQTPQSFSQSVHELFIALHRTGDPAQLIVISMHLERLAGIDASPDAKSPSWQQLADIMTSLKEVVSGLPHQMQQNRDANHNQKHLMADRTDPNSTSSQPSPQNPNKFDATRPYCRGNFAGNDDENERIQWVPVPHNMNGNFYPTGQPFPSNYPNPSPALPGLPPQGIQGLPPQGMGPQGMPPRGMGHQNLGVPGGMCQSLPQPGMCPQNVPPQMAMPIGMYQGYIMPAPIRMDVPDMPVPMPAVPNGDMIQSAGFVPIPQRYATGPEDGSVPFGGGGFQAPMMMPPIEPALPAAANHGPPVPNNSPYTLEEMSTDLLPEYWHNRQSFQPGADAQWAQHKDVFTFGSMNDALPNISDIPCSSKGVYAYQLRQPSVNSALQYSHSDDHELEKELQALEKRICTEFKSTD